MHLFRFIKNVVKEMKLVVWPTVKENRRDTAVVVSLSVFFMLFFALFDWLIESGLLIFTK
ncbi:preprotein translocase subunit SecE [Paucilactobacillus nenjiangensis]|jgi:preprotein translocase subunit SecE|uniref:Protein translocase subunit SecE n=1 Tax=Paucilactobacillus nenjiangensis TaxID=1296540 RepID=A0A5P1X3P4_9LACO|nr:preprotein translocase subunit SecE [Paucilactobacillus nenjiangensis]QER68025.1 preprotein translocase subunit SecE [Paucilactobacillus nenjiangensis]